MEPGKWYIVRKKPIEVKAMKMDVPFKCETPSGWVQGNAGDILMIGASEETYPCKPDIFEKTYDVIREE